jgi:hypothetical protein
MGKWNHINKNLRVNANVHTSFLFFAIDRLQVQQQLQDCHLQKLLQKQSMHLSS